MPVELLQTEAGEVRVETGIGVVTALNVRPGRRNHAVELNADHLRIEVKAWVDGTDVELMERLALAHEQGLRVCYRVEVRRKARAPLDVPIADLERDDKVRDLADLVHVNGAGDPLQPLRHQPGAGAPASPPAAAPEPSNIGGGNSTTDVAKPVPDQVAGGEERRPTAAERAQRHAAAPPRPPADGEPLCPACGLSLLGAALRVVDGDRVHKVCPDQRGQSPNVDAPPPDPEADGISMREAGAQATAQRQALRDAEGRLCGVCQETVPAAELGAHIADHTRLAQEAAADAAAADAPPADGPPPVDPATLRPSMRDRFGRGPRLAEAKPWEPTNSDGSLNLGSFAYQASLGMVSLAAELLMERNRAQAIATGGQLEAPTGPQIRGLARLLLRASDKAQAGIRSDGRVDRGDNSHTRARGAVRSALDWFPPPWGADEAHRLAWCDALADHAWTMLTVAVGLVDPDGDL